MILRLIKFRAYHKRWKMMFKVLAIDFESGEVTLTDDGCFTGYALMKDVELMQYTNQKNSKGQDIHEGDYVSKELNNGFDYGAFEGVVDMIDGEWVVNNEYDHLESLFSEFEDIEILGNIYENPELLEVNKDV